MEISYRADVPVSPRQFMSVLSASGLGARRPVDDAECMEQMVRNAALMVTAWADGQLIGVARSVTDFAYCCYLSDLAVSRDFQGRGIGRGLLRSTRAQLGPRCKLILLAAPAASGYYGHVGFQRHADAWILGPDNAIR